MDIELLVKTATQIYCSCNPLYYNNDDSLENMKTSVKQAHKLIKLCEEELANEGWYTPEEKEIPVDRLVEIMLKRENDNNTKTITYASMSQKTGELRDIYTNEVYNLEDVYKWKGV